MSRSQEWKEKRDKIIEERLPSVILSLESVGVKDFKINNYSIDFELNTRHVEFFIYTGTIIWEGRDPEKLGKGIRTLIKMIKKEKLHTTLDSYRDD